ncbi:MAG: hypothetical protein LBB73_07405 [Dysgonamonadaceae bacterium]|jgi:predicted helicase|nr:hypothetical protein [Dysgonamonadaceae bacterium]
MEKSSIPDENVNVLDPFTGTGIFITRLIQKGRQTSMEEAFMKKEEIAKERLDDWEELQNYIVAMNEAMVNLLSLPFSSRLIRQTHRTFTGRKRQTQTAEIIISPVLSKRDSESFALRKNGISCMRSFS